METKLISPKNINVEIERRWILHNLPYEARHQVALYIEQWYHESEKGVIRYRATTNTDNNDEVLFEKIIKLPVSKGINTEEHLPIDKDKFYKELSNDMRYISKTRWVTVAGHRYEIDVFNDSSLIILEVELNNLDEIIFPDWLQKEIIAEITGMKEFSNYNLAKVA